MIILFLDDDGNEHHWIPEQIQFMQSRIYSVFARSVAFGVGLLLNALFGFFLNKTTIVVEYVCPDLITLCLLTPV